MWNSISFLNISHYCLYKYFFWKEEIALSNNILVKMSVQRDLSTKFHKIKKVGLSIMTMLCMFCMCAMPCFAEGKGGKSSADAGLSQFNNVINVLATWIGRIGLVIGFVGAIQFAMGIKDSDADSKSKGLMTLASGFVVFGICTAYDAFFAN